MGKTPKETVTFRLDPAYRMLLRENAKERNMTVTQVMKQMLDAYLNAWRQHRAVQGITLSNKEIDRVLGRVDNRMLEAIIREGEME